MSITEQDVYRFGPAAKKQIAEKMRQSSSRRVKSGQSGSKMHNVKTVVNGITFDSKKEAERYDELMILLKGGVITDLRLQHNITITEGYKKPNGETVRPQVYKADFSYIKDGKRIYEDAKGMRTQTFINKKKTVYDLRGIEIREV